MSTISGGATGGTYENLSALLEFVKSPEYLERIRELRDLEASSRAAKAEADQAQSALNADKANLEIDKASHLQAARQLAADQGAHNLRVTRWNKAMSEVQKALRGED